MISSATLERIGSKYESMQNRLKNIKETAEKTMGTVLQTVEVVGGCAAAAYANGRYGQPDTVSGTGLTEWNFHSVPLDAGVGVVMHGLGFFGAFGRYDEHAHNLGDGLLASYAYRLGNKQGLKAAANDANRHSTSGVSMLGQGNPYARGWRGTPMQSRAPWGGVG